MPDIRSAIPPFCRTICHRVPHTKDMDTNYDICPFDKVTRTWITSTPTSIFLMKAKCRSTFMIQHIIPTTFITHKFHVGESQIIQPTITMLCPTPASECSNRSSIRCRMRQFCWLNEFREFKRFLKYEHTNVIVFLVRIIFVGNSFSNFSFFSIFFFVNESSENSERRM